MIIEFLKYLLWASIQHLILILPLTLFVPYNLDRVFYGILFFSFVYHAGNLKLTLLCLLLASVFYPLYFLLDYKIIFGCLLVISHAVAGTLVNRYGVEMRVWRFEK